MKILYFVQSLGKGGAERIVLDICNELNNRINVEYLLVSFSELNEYPLLSNKVNHVYCRSTINLSVLKNNKINIDELLKIISNFNPDIIHSNVYKSELLSREKTFENIKYFTHCHNNMPEFNPFSLKTLFNKELLVKFYEKKRIEKKYIKCDNQFIAISKDTVNFYKKNLSKKLRNNVHFLTNAINYKRFENKKRKEPNGILSLIMVGHLSDNKNQIFLVSVLKKLRKNNLNAELTLLGDWKNNGKKIMAKANSLELQNYINMPGIVNNVEEYLKKSDIYLHSSHSESFGLVLVESMASSLPVICLDGKGNRDIIIEGKNGYMIYEQDAEKFANRIIQLWNDKQKMKEISEYSQEFAKQYDIVNYVDKLLDLYQNTIDLK